MFVWACPQESTVTGGGTAHLLGPAARVLMEAHGLAPSQITPTGPRGNITKGDVLAAVEAGTKPAAKPAPPKAAEESPRPGATVPSAQRAKPSASAPAGATAGAASSVPTGAGAEGSEDVPTTTMRKVIARRLLESKTQVPHAFFQTEVCMDEVAELRKALASRGVKVSVNDLVLAAAAAALKEVPGANVTWDEAEGRPRALPAVDINVAVATDAGLITPIVTGADRRGLLGISKEVKALATVSARAATVVQRQLQASSPPASLAWRHSCLPPMPLLPCARDGVPCDSHGSRVSETLRIGHNHVANLQSTRRQTRKTCSDCDRFVAQRAKENKLKPEEFMGGSFTLSNLGMFGTGSFYAIVNPPQGAILAVGRSVPKVMLAGSKPVQKSYMTASLSADSRAITPEIAAQFLDALRANLESPSNFLLM